jgi:hypothetical protein
VVASSEAAEAAFCCAGYPLAGAVLQGTANQASRPHLIHTNPEDRRSPWRMKTGILGQTFNSRRLVPNGSDVGGRPITLASIL